jgi:hypothetical protein
VRISLIGSIIAVAAALPLPSVVPAQTSRPSAAAVAPAPQAAAFNRHDLNGIWAITTRKQLVISTA